MWQNSTHIHIIKRRRNSQETGNSEELHNLIKCINKQLTANTAPNNERLGWFSLEFRQGVTLTTFFQHVAASLSWCNNFKREIKSTQMRREEMKLFTFEDDIIIYVEIYFKKSSRTKGKFSKFSGYQINMQKAIVFQYTGSEHINTKF